MCSEGENKRNQDPPPPPHGYSPPAGSVDAGYGGRHGTTGNLLADMNFGALAEDTKFADWSARYSIEALSWFVPIEGVLSKGLSIGSRFAKPALSVIKPWFSTAKATGRGWLQSGKAFLHRGVNTTEGWWARNFGAPKALSASPVRNWASAPKEMTGNRIKKMAKAMSKGEFDWAASGPIRSARGASCALEARGS